MDNIYVLPPSPLVLTLKNSLNILSKLLKNKLFCKIPPSGWKLALKICIFARITSKTEQFHAHFIWRVFWDWKIFIKFLQCAMCKICDTFSIPKSGGGAARATRPSFFPSSSWLLKIFGSWVTNFQITQIHSVCFMMLPVCISAQWAM